MIGSKVVIYFWTHMDHVTWSNPFKHNYNIYSFDFGVSTKGMKFRVKLFWTFPSWSFVPNNFPQCSQALSFWCVILVCLSKACLDLKVFPHRSQMKGRSIWWHIICVLSVEADMNFFSHWLQANGRCSGNLCVFKWEFRLVIETKVLPHSPHSNGRSPVWCLLNQILLPVLQTARHWLYLVRLLQNREITVLRG